MLSQWFVFRWSENFTSLGGIRVPLTVPVNHYSGVRNQQNSTRVLFNYPMLIREAHARRVGSCGARRAGAQKRNHTRKGLGREARERTTNGRARMACGVGARRCRRSVGVGRTPPRARGRRTHSERAAGAPTATRVRVWCAQPRAPNAWVVNCKTDLRNQG